jgi:sterol desaturase/sphingolipid hydroxylase (fatty acid hydroxylase superfamily)
MEFWMNFLRRTRREYYADFFITPPITAALLGLSLYTSLDAWWAPKFLAGWLGWTLYEYAVHRLAHVVGPLRRIHWLHHDRQKDYIAVHPLVTLAQYALVAAVLGVGSSAATVGFSTGYIVYSAMHTAFHYATIRKGHWLYGLRLRHVEHHRREVNFGVSVCIWDRLLGTEGRV